MHLTCAIIAKSHDEAYAILDELVETDVLYEWYDDGYDILFTKQGEWMCSCPVRDYEYNCHPERKHDAERTWEVTVEGSPVSDDDDLYHDPKDYLLRSFKDKEELVNYVISEHPGAFVGRDRKLYDGWNYKAGEWARMWQAEVQNANPDDMIVTFDLNT